jgi:hypothetical protein
VGEVGDDERGREEEQAEDEVPDEAVALPASDTGGPERDRDPDDSKQDPPEGICALPLPRERFSASFDVAAPGRPAHHPGITPGGVI